MFVSTNADANGDLVPYEDPFGFGVTLFNEADVNWTRIDAGESATPITPQRFVSGISVDPNDPNHAWISYSGYDAYATAAGTPTGHVFEVHFHPATGTTTCTGSATFNVVARATAAVPVSLTCRDTSNAGSILINGAVTFCPVIDGLSANPDNVVVGSSLALGAAVRNPDGGAEPALRGGVARAGARVLRGGG